MVLCLASIASCVGSMEVRYLMVSVMSVHRTVPIAVLKVTSSMPYWVSSIVLVEDD